MFITDRLTNTLDWRTFELTEVAFGDVLIAVPPRTQHFEKNVKMTFNGVEFEVQIEAGIRLATGEVYATYRSIVPATGLPPAVDIGFLPPENGTGRGTGRIGYTIRALTNLATGTEIRNIATIQFDSQPGLRTDLVDPHDPGAGIDPNRQALVTIDADPPTSSVMALGSEANPHFVVYWNGSDLGSGISSYDTYLSENGGSWTLWLGNTTNTSAMFSGLPGRSYAFYSVARDNTGYVESTPSAPDTQTVTVPELALTAAFTGGSFTLQFSTQAGRHYRVEFRDDLAKGSWAPLAGYDNLMGTGSAQTVSQPIVATMHRFYRVVRLP